MGNTKSREVPADTTENINNNLVISDVSDDTQQYYTVSEMMMLGLIILRLWEIVNWIYLNYLRKTKKEHGPGAPGASGV